MQFVKTQVQFLLLTCINIGTTLIIILTRHLLTLLPLYVYISSTCVRNILCIYICVSNKILFKNIIIINVVILVRNCLANGVLIYEL